MNKTAYNLIRRCLCVSMAFALALSHPAAVYAAEDGSEEFAAEASQEVQEPKDVPETVPASPPEIDPEPAQETASETILEEAADSVPLQDSEPSAEAETVPEETQETAAAASAENSASGRIHIDGNSFSSDADESSHWNDGKGWKNVPGEYLALVDYDGSDSEISADEGTLKLAVAGVNRIGKLKGDFSVEIIGTGIVLIDSIEIEEGNTITLHPNTSLYEEGSAAVFLKQEEDGSYLLINGSVPGILDEDYSLDDVELNMPEGSSIVLSAMARRTETWFSDDTGELETDVSTYKDYVPWESLNPSHDNGTVEFNELASRLVLGEKSILTVGDGASVRLESIENEVINPHFVPAASALIIKGILNVLGVAEGGFVEICSGGALTGQGTVLSSEVSLEAGGNLSENILLDSSGLTVTGDNMSLSTQLKDSILYLKGSNVNVEELKVSGTSWIGADTFENLGIFHSGRIGNITLDPGSELQIVCNDHYYVPEHGEFPRNQEDCFLTISGKIIGGTVSVLAGCVEYTGEQTDILPVVPEGYTSRVLVSEMDIDSTIIPLNVSREDAAVLAKSSWIPVFRVYVIDTLVSDRILARKWVVQSQEELKPLEKKNDQSYTCASFLDDYGLQGEMSGHTHFTAVEVIHEDLSRQRYFLGDDTEFSTDDAILIRVLDCSSQGGQGGGSATHIDTAFTGSGVLGGIGKESVTAGVGTVIFGKPSSIPEPDDNTDPEPEDKPGDDIEKEENDDRSETEKHDQEQSAAITEPDERTERRASVSNDRNNDSRLNVTVALREPLTETVLKEDSRLPQIWTLSVTRNGRAVTELNGTVVQAVFPFTIPETWEMPDEAGESSLYAVFADEEKVLAAYTAQYDPETGNISFETEKTGDFVIVQFAYEEEPFTEEFYLALAELEEIREFLALLEEEREAGN